MPCLFTCQPTTPHHRLTATLLLDWQKGQGVDDLTIDDAPVWTNDLDEEAGGRRDRSLARV